MFNKYSLKILVLISFSTILFAQNSSKLKIFYIQNNEIAIVVDSLLHVNYGFAYPMTYSIIIPENSSQLITYTKHSKNGEWLQVQEKTSDDFFNGIEAVRYDYLNSIAYISLAFSSSTDSIFIRMTNMGGGDNIPIVYLDICQYYDNRKAVVTTSADDWDKYKVDEFNKAINFFRVRNLWLSCGVITDSISRVDPSTWQIIQNQLDSGFIEVLSHSRTHVHPPYNYYSEIVGSKNDIINNLNLPSLFRNNEREYIYAYIEPYGDYDDSVDFVAGQANYLVNRGVFKDFYDFSTWNENKHIYERADVSFEIGPLDGGITDLNLLNQTFDFILQNHKIYHPFIHPLYINEYHLWNLLSQHLDYISNRKDVWYTAFGHLYLYHFLEDGDYTPIIVPWLFVTPMTQSVGYAADSVTFTMGSNTNWIINSNVGWLEALPDSGKGNETITVKCLDNTDTTQRVGKVIFVGEGITDTLKVIQAAHPYVISLTPKIENVGYLADSIKLTVASNTNWTVSKDVDWLTVFPDSNLGSQTITAVYSENKDTTQRVVVITIYGSGIADTIRIIQTAHPRVLTVTPMTQNIGYFADSTTLTIVSNTSWTVSDDSEWLTEFPDSSSGNGAITVTYSKNFSIAPREGSLTITWSDSTTVVTITQAGLLIHISSRIFLEGPYDSTSGQMNTFLNDSIPTTSPYTQDPRTVSVIPEEVVDWVLVELRATDSSSAIISKSVFIDRDGYIVSDDGNTKNVLLGAVSGNYYVVIKHRNHLAIMSANAVATVNDTLKYDFTIGSNQFYGGSDGAQEIKSGVWGMIPGDGDGNGQIQNDDSEETWKQENGESGYRNGDYNMNGQVQNDDNEKYWKNNNGKGSPVPNL